MNSLFREDALRATNNLSGNVNISQLVPLTVLTYVILFILVITAIFLFNSYYTKKATVQGYIFPLTGYTKVYTQLSGVLSDIYVAEGERVDVGQPLFKVGTKISLANDASYHDLIASNLAQISINIKGQIDVEKNLLNNTLVQIDYDIKSLTEQISVLRSQQEVYMQRVKINQDVVDDYQRLASVGHASRLDLGMQRYGLLSLHQAGIAIDSEIISLTRQLTDRKNQKMIAALESKRRLSDLQSQLYDIENQLAAANFSSENIVTSPRSGIVTGITYAEGSMVSQGGGLLSILPAEPNFHGVVYVPTTSIGFMRIGQSVRVRVRAFPYQRFGIIEGTVIEVADVATNYDHYFDVSIPELSYRVFVRLNNEKIFAYGKSYDLRLGMEIEADVMLDERSLLQWLFEPIYSLRGKL